MQMFSQVLADDVLGLPPHGVRYLRRQLWYFYPYKSLDGIQSFVLFL